MHAIAVFTARHDCDLVQEVSREFVPDCAKADDTIEDAEDRDLSLTEFFVKVPVKGSSYDHGFMFALRTLWKRSLANGRPHQSSHTLGPFFPTLSSCVSCAPRLGQTWLSRLRFYKLLGAWWSVLVQMHLLLINEAC